MADQMRLPLHDYREGDDARAVYASLVSSQRSKELTRHNKSSTLIRLLFSKANERDLSAKDMADELGVTYGYLMQLKNGIRRCDAVSSEFSSSCAKFLGIPKVGVLIASGVVNVTDFYEDGESLEGQIDRALYHIKNDPETGFMYPDDIDGSDLLTRYFVVSLFERATHQVLVPRPVDLETFVNEMGLHKVCSVP